MAAILIAHAILSSANTATSSAIDTTGATLIVINYSGMNPVAVTDSKGNTWNALTRGGTNGGSTLLYAQSPSLVAGPGHTFTVTGTSISANLIVQVWSGIGGFSAQSAAGGGVSAIGNAPGALNPSTIPGTLFVTGYEKETGPGAVFSVGSGFTISDQAYAGLPIGGAMAWKISSAPENPAWTGDTAAGRNGATMATFLPLAAGNGSSTGIAQSVQAVGVNLSTTIAVMPLNVTAGNLLIVMTGHPAGNDCFGGATPAVFTDTRGLTFSSVKMSQNVSGLQSNCCIAMALVTSSGPETITRTVASSSVYPTNMLVVELIGIGSPAVVSTNAAQVNGGTTTNSGAVTSALANLLLVGMAADGQTTFPFTSATPLGGAQYFPGSQGAFLIQRVGPGTYTPTFVKAGGGGNFSAAAALISFIPAVEPVTTTVSVTCSIVIPPAFGTLTGIWLDLWVWRQLWHLDALTDTVSFLPVYRRALVMGLARELCREYGRDPAVVEQQADQAMAELEQSNVEIRTEGVKDLEQS